MESEILGVMHPSGWPRAGFIIFMDHNRNPMTQEFIHPEKRPDEIFFTNATRVQFKLMRWISKRKGAIAYDGEGNRLEYKNWFPIFLKKEELDNVQTDLRTERKTWVQLMKQLN